MFFKTYPQNMLQKYNEIWNKISNLLKKKGLIVNQCIMINTIKLKQKLTIISQ